MSLEELFDVLFQEAEEYQEAMDIDEEEQEQERNLQFQQLLAKRRRLYALGMYELEDGEILE